jgi:Spy/CpxP family protein refolding chaperone
MERQIGRRARRIVLTALVIFCLCPAALEAAEAGQGLVPGRSRTSPPVMRMRPMTLMAMIHLWQDYLIAQKGKLGLKEDQVAKIESILNSQKEYLIRKNAERKILVLEIQSLLLAEKIDLGGVEGKVKAMEALFADMIAERARALESALAVLTPEQRFRVRAFFRESTFPRAMRLRQALGWMTE